jgi:outer membrane protein, heavy metal efflux system
VATARYAAGLASQQDPLEAEAELAHLLHDGVLLRSQLAIVEAEINALLHRPPAAVLPSPPPELSVPPFDDAGVEAEALEAQAFAQRPELRRAEAATRARQAELELAKLSGRPDFAVSASYNSMWTDPEHRWMVGASMTLPVWRGRVAAAVAMAEASLAQAKTEYDARQDEVRRDVALALVRSREAHHVLELFRSRLLPVAKDRVQAALAGFRSGKNDFLALIEAERGLRSVKLEYHQALSDVYRRRAELDAALGSPVSFAEDRNQGGGR